MNKWEELLEAEGLGVITAYNPPKTAKGYFSIRGYWRAADNILHHYKFTSPVEKKVWELHIAGESAKRIAEATNSTLYSVYQTLRTIRANNSLPKYLIKRTPWAQTEQDKAILNLRGQGMSYKKIAKALNLKNKYVARNCIRRHSTPR